MRVLLVTVFITAAVTTAEAQILGYGVAGPAGTSGFIDTGVTFHGAGGAEIVAGDRVGVGSEFGVFDRLITTSGNLTVYVAGQRGFVSGGYSRMGIGDGEEAFSAFNVGAGAHVWFGEHTGLRLEFRDHMRPDDRGTTHYWTARAGIVFR